jgi:hypothetical protein
MGASFMYASADSLDMSWLPLSRFESRIVCVAVSRLGECEGRARVPHPISVGSRRRGTSVRPWMGASFRYASADSLGMPWLPLSRFESRRVCVAVSRLELVAVCAGLGARGEGGCHTKYPLEVGAEVYR